MTLVYPRTAAQTLDGHLTHRPERGVKIYECGSGGVVAS